MRSKRHKPASARFASAGRGPWVRLGGHMELTLGSTERELLLEILEKHHGELLVEIARTRHHEFKHFLQNKEKLLESVFNKLELGQCDNKVVLRLISGPAAISNASARYKNGVRNPFC